MNSSKDGVVICSLPYRRLVVMREGETVVEVYDERGLHHVVVWEGDSLATFYQENHE